MQPQTKPVGFIERLNKMLTHPIATRLAAARWVSADAVTWASAVVGGIMAPVALLSDLNLVAAALIVCGALLDSLDGDLARVRGTARAEGAILDAVLDRYVDFALVASLLVAAPDCISWGLAAILGAFMVPYIRARTEAAGRASVTTIASRDTRNFILVIGIATGQYCPTLAVIAVLANLSAIHRFYHAIRRA